MQYLNIILVLFGLFFSQTLALLSDTLVLTDNKEDFSKFIDAISDNGLTYTLSDINSDPETQILDVNNKILYSNILILPIKSKKLSSNIDHDTLLKYADNGGNVIIIADSDKGTQLDCTLFLNQLGIYPAPKNYQFIDYHSDSRNSLTISSSNALNNYIISQDIELELNINNPMISLISNSPYLIPLFQTPRTSFTKNNGNNQVWHSGNEGYLGISFQGLNNGRITFFGTSLPFNNENFNKELSNDLIQWTYQLKSVIKSTIFNHKKVDKDGVELPFIDEDDYYKVKDYSYFEIGLSEYDLKSQSWIPFKANDNVQLEFIMLDPYQRINLNQSSIIENSAIYNTIFQIPDQHGMFTFKVDYKRPGLSFINVEDVVPVRHLANDEYARSWEIPNSSVYMAGYGVVIIGWLLFVVIFVLSSGKNIDLTKKNE